MTDTGTENKSEAESASLPQIMRKREKLVVAFVLMVVLLYFTITIFLFLLYENFFYDYQALIGGGLAFNAALLTTGFFTWKHVADDRRFIKNSAEIMLAFVNDWVYQMARLNTELEDFKNMRSPIEVADQFANCGFTEALQYAGVMGGNIVSVLLRQRSKVAAKIASYERIYNQQKAVTQYNNLTGSSSDFANLQSTVVKEISDFRKDAKDLLLSNTILTKHLSEIAAYGFKVDFTNAELQIFYPEYRYSEGMESKRPSFFYSMLRDRWDDEF